jgi:Uncharacterized protein conserved in bacteria (DUF2252)
VVEDQRLMQAASDIFLGWLRQPFGLEDLKVRDLYVRQLWDSKITADIGAMSASDMALYARLCAWTLAPPTRARVTRSPSGATWAPQTSSIARRRPSPRRMPTRPSATTPRSWTL